MSKIPPQRTKAIYKTIIVVCSNSHNFKISGKNNTLFYNGDCTYGVLLLLLAVYKDRMGSFVFSLGINNSS